MKPRDSKNIGLNPIVGRPGGEAAEDPVADLDQALKAT
jgi:hypothetical protein